MHPPTRAALLTGATALLALLLSLPLCAQTEPTPTGEGAVGPQAPPVVETRLVVRAVSNNAKLVGSGVGGARITIRHADTGALLAEGVQEGGTGDTEAIMAPRARDATPFDTDGSAAFRTSLPLAGPTPVEVTAEGPLGTPHAGQRSSKTLLVVPGRHIDGQGLTLVLHGFTVEFVEAPSTVAPGSEVPVRVRVTMLCGCPTEPGGRWDSRDWQMEAELLGPLDGDDVPPAAAVAAPLRFSGETSVYETTLSLPALLDEGAWTLRAVVTDTERVNTGMVERIVRVAR